MLTDFYTAFSPTCFSLLSLWFVVITINARIWFQSPHQQQAYAVALYFAAPGTMSLLALIDPASTSLWRVVFVLISVAGMAGLFVFGPLHHGRPHDALAVSDHLVHWVAIILYVAIAIVACIPGHVLRVEGGLLTLLVLVGIHVALRMMFAIGGLQSGNEQTSGTAKTTPVANTPSVN